MRIYNTLTRSKEPLVPLEEGKIRIYTCGPTVYNYFHIGNARVFVVFDAFRTYLEYRGYEVTFVQNFTDIDDKIIHKAAEEGVSAQELSERYIQEYFKDAKAIGIRPATLHPKVTEHIPDIIAFIEELIAKGYAYADHGDVFFDTERYGKRYGELSGQDLEELNHGARVESNQQKRHPADFVLWKARKENEPGWPSPWGEGRPGWHIECSVMSSKYLGETIDIHAGGPDLIFPHHENEIAQSQARSGKPFARYWMHIGFINIDNQKMSKSLNNFVTVHDIITYMDPQVVRFFLLSAHYRNPINFSAELLEMAKASWTRLRNARENLIFTLQNAPQVPSSEKEQACLLSLENYQSRFVQAMDDDFNTADGISVLFEMARMLNSHTDENSSHAFLTKALALYEELTGVLRLFEPMERDDSQDTDWIEQKIEARAQAKKAKDFALADQLREELLKKGIELEDTRNGTKWKQI